VLLSPSWATSLSWERPSNTTPKRSSPQQVATRGAARTLPSVAWRHSGESEPKTRRLQDGRVRTKRPRQEVAADRVGSTAWLLNGPFRARAAGIAIARGLHRIEQREAEHPGHEAADMGLPGDCLVGAVNAERGETEQQVKAEPDGEEHQRARIAQHR